MPSIFTIALVQLLVGALLFVSLLYGQRDLSILCLLVLGVSEGTRVWARLSLSRVSFRLDADKRQGFPGEHITLRIRAENGKLLPIWLEILIPIESLMQPDAPRRILSKSTSLLWFQRMQFDWPFVADRRGVYRIGPLDVLAGDLFSFFSRRKQAPEFYSIVVYPRPVPLKTFALPRRDFFGMPRAKSSVQDPIYILGTRDYAPGQPSKYIHWKASARHDRLQEKVFESTLREKVLLIVNVESFTRRAAEEEFERVLEIVASLATRLDRQGHSVGLVANGAVIGAGLASVPVARNAQQLPTLLEMLARLKFKQEGDLAERLRHRLALTWGVTGIYFCAVEDETVVQAERFFDQHHSPVMFVVSQRSPFREGRPANRSKVYRADELRAGEVSQ